MRGFFGTDCRLCQVGKSGVQTRVMLLPVVFLLGFIAVSAFNADRDREGLLTERKTKTRHVVEATHGVLSHSGPRRRPGGCQEGRH